MQYTVKPILFSHQISNDCQVRVFWLQVCIIRVFSYIISVAYITSHGSQKTPIKNYIANILSFQYLI